MRWLEGPRLACFSAGVLLCHCASLSFAICFIERPLIAEVSSAFAESVSGLPALMSSHLLLSSSRRSFTRIHSPFSFLPRMMTCILPW